MSYTPTMPAASTVDATPSTAATSNNRNNNNASFLTIPGEIRNRIFDLVLQAPANEPLRFGKESVNQLQYVCRHLRAETQHLELKLNPEHEIEITGTLEKKKKKKKKKGRSATDRFLQFIGNVPHARSFWINRVNLHNNIAPGITIRDEIKEIRWTKLRLEYLASVRPKMKINYNVATWSQSSMMSEPAFEGDVSTAIMAIGWLITTEVSNDVILPQLWPANSKVRGELVDFEGLQRTVLAMNPDRGGESLTDLSSESGLRFFPMADILDTDPYYTCGSYSQLVYMRDMYDIWEVVAEYWWANGI